MIDLAVGSASSNSANAETGAIPVTPITLPPVVGRPVAGGRWARRAGVLRAAQRHPPVEPPPPMSTKRVAAGAGVSLRPMRLASRSRRRRWTSGARCAPAPPHPTPAQRARGRRSRPARSASRRRGRRTGTGRGNLGSAPLRAPRSCGSAWGGCTRPSADRTWSAGSRRAAGRQHAVSLRVARLPSAAHPGARFLTNHVCHDLTPTLLARMAHVPEGGNWTDIPRRLHRRGRHAETPLPRPSSR